MKRNKIQLERLESLEREFCVLLAKCLEECGRGRWGLFGTFDYLGADKRYWNWPEADLLREIATEIQAILSESGQRNALCAEFLELCRNHGQNDPGEPKLARAFLERLEEGKS
jgi:hypothetical protein